MTTYDVSIYDERGDANDEAVRTAIEVGRVLGPVFTLKPDTKAPSIEDGFYAARSRQDDILDMASTRPGHLWALRTGKASGVVVIDADDAEALEYMQKRFGEPHVYTSRGGHYYFGHPGGKIASLSKLGKFIDGLPHKLDRKGDGGYVGIPPLGNKSWVDGIPDKGALLVLPEDLRGRGGRGRGGTADAAHDGKVNADAADAIAAEIPPNGKHDLMLKLAGTMLDGGVSEADTTATLLKAWSDAGALYDEARRDIEGGVASTAAKRKADVPAWGRTALDEACPGLSDKLRVAYGWIKSREVVTSGKAQVASSAPADVGDHAEVKADKRPADKRPADKGDDKAPARDRMYALAARYCTPFKDQYGDPYIITDEGAIVPLKSATDWLSLLWLGKTGNVARAEDSKAVREMLSARARMGDRQHTLHTRFAQYDGRVYIDLMQDRIAEARPDGWQVLSYGDAPVLFRPNPSADPIPTPVRGGSIDELAEHLRSADAASTRLRTSFIVTAPIADTPRPIMETTGDAGSGKTSDQRTIKRLIDPCKVDTLKLRRKALLQNLLFHAVPLFDNLAHIDQDTSDDLCSASTGGGYEDRELYTQESQVARSFKRAVMINGVATPGDRADLQSRVLPIRLSPPGSGERKTEAAMQAAFEAARPRLLGAVLDALCASLRHFDPHAPIPNDLRLADWAVYLVGIYKHAGWGKDTMFADLAGLDEDRAEAVINGSLVGRMLLKLAEAAKLPKTFRTADLYERCKNLAEASEGVWAFPRSPSAFSRRLSEAKYTLRVKGLIVEPDRDNKGGIVHLSRVGGPSYPGSGDGIVTASDGVSTLMPSPKKPISMPKGVDSDGSDGILHETLSSPPSRTFQEEIDTGGGSDVPRDVGKSAVTAVTAVTEPADASTHTYDYSRRAYTTGGKIACQREALNIAPQYRLADAYDHLEVADMVRLDGFRAAVKIVERARIPDAYRHVAIAISGWQPGKPEDFRDKSPVVADTEFMLRRVVELRRAGLRTEARAVRTLLPDRITWREASNTLTERDRRRIAEEQRRIADMEAAQAAFNAAVASGELPDPETTDLTDMIIACLEADRRRAAAREIIEQGGVSPLSEGSDM